MAFAAAARRNLASRGLSGLLEGRLRPSIPQLLPSNCTGEPRKPSPLPPPPAPRSFNFGFATCGTSQTLNFLPFGLHLLPGPPRRSFSSSSPRDIDFTGVLTDTAHAAAPAASFPGEVAWAAEESSMAVAAVQHLIDAVHSFTGLNWWISIALSTALLRSVSFTLWMLSRKRLYEMRQEMQQTSKLLNNVKDGASREEAVLVVLSSLKKLNLQEGMEGNSMAGKMKMFSRGMAVMTVPFTMNFAKGIFCYWITSNLFSLVYGIVVRQPAVRKLFNLPAFEAQSAPALKSAIDLFGGSKAVPSAKSPLAITAAQQSSLEKPDAAALGYRVKNLEKKVKSRGNSRKRR